MNTSSHPNVVIRVVMSLALFFLGLGGLAWIAIYLTQDSPRSPISLLNPSVLHREVVADKQHEPLFYTAIGRAPSHTSPSASQSGRFTIEIAEVYSKAEAESMVHELASKGVETYFTPYSQAGTVVFRIRRGVFISERKAAAAAAELLEKQNIASVVVRM